jgi:HK97 gp10 family phage protein
MNEKGGVELLGLKEIDNILKTLIPREANNLSKNMIAGFAQYAAKEFKSRVPNETGNLKRSIKAVKGRSFPGKPVSYVKASKGKRTKGGGFYWRFVEHGIGGKNPQGERPFVRPVLLQMQADMPKLIDEIFTKKLAGAVKRAKKRIAKRG